MKTLILTILLFIFQIDTEAKEKTDYETKYQYYCQDCRFVYIESPERETLGAFVTSDNNKN